MTMGIFIRKTLIDLTTKAMACFLLQDKVIIKWKKNTRFLQYLKTELYLA